MLCTSSIIQKKFLYSLTQNYKKHSKDLTSDPSTAASHPHWSFVWTKKEANCAAHVLAGWSQSCCIDSLVSIKIWFIKKEKEKEKNTLNKIVPKMYCHVTLRPNILSIVYLVDVTIQSNLLKKKTQLQFHHSSHICINILSSLLFSLLPSKRNHAHMLHKEKC